MVTQFVLHQRQYPPTAQMLGKVCEIFSFFFFKARRVWDPFANGIDKTSMAKIKGGNS
jgi:hypothetical protein